MQLVQLKYTGKKPYRDDWARLDWKPGQAQLVTTEASRYLLGFVEFERVNDKPKPEEHRAAVERVAQQSRHDDEQRQEVEGVLLLVQSMDKQALADYAAKYEVALDKRIGLDKARAQVANLIEQFGAR